MPNFADEINERILKAITEAMKKNPNLDVNHCFIKSDRRIELDLKDVSKKETTKITIYLDGNKKEG